MDGWQRTSQQEPKHSEQSQQVQITMIVKDKLVKSQDKVFDSDNIFDYDQEIRFLWIILVENTDSKVLSKGEERSLNWLLLSNLIIPAMENAEAI